MSIPETRRSTKDNFCPFFEKHTAPFLHHQSDMKNIIAHITLNICLALLAVTSVQAQGWERILSTLGQEELLDVVETAEGGYLSVGYFNGLKNVYLVKTYADGRLQWSRKYNFFNNLNTSCN